MRDLVADFVGADPASLSVLKAPLPERPWKTKPIRNSRFWLRGWDFSACVLATTAASLPYQRGGVLIAPDKVLFAAHFAPTAGSEVFWLTPSGRQERRTIRQMDLHPGYRWSNPYCVWDVALATLALPVNTIRPLPLVSLPALQEGGTRWATGRGNVEYRYAQHSQPCLWLNADKEVRVGVVQSVLDLNPHAYRVSPEAGRPQILTFQLLSPGLHSGDSGHPVLLPTVDGRLGVLGVLTYPGAVTIASSTASFLITQGAKVEVL